MLKFRRTNSTIAAETAATPLTKPPTSRPPTFTPPTRRANIPTSAAQQGPLHRRSESEHNVDTSISQLRRTDSSSSFFVGSQLGYSKATVVLRNISVPLAWPADEYFGNRKEFREFTVQLVLRSNDGIQQCCSRPRERVNRTHTDVEFTDEEFVFVNQAPDFCIELCLHCRRTDSGAASGGQWGLPSPVGTARLVTKVTRSLSRGVGDSVRRAFLQSNHHQPYLHSSLPGRRRGTGAKRLDTLVEEVVEGEGILDVDSVGPSLIVGRMSLLATARFRLRNATLNGKTHAYNMDSTVARMLLHSSDSSNISHKSQVLPIYGSIFAQLLVQPSSLVDPPLAEGNLDVFFVEGGALAQKQYCRLKGGWLKCWGDATDVGTTTSTEKTAPSISIQLNQDCLVEATAFPTALRLTLPESRHYLLIGGSQRSFLGWKSALSLQILDCSIWSDFALSHRNPHGAAAIGPTALLQQQEPSPTRASSFSIVEETTSTHFSAHSGEVNGNGCEENGREREERRPPIALGRSATSITPEDATRRKFHFEKRKADQHLRRHSTAVARRLEQVAQPGYSLPRIGGLGARCVGKGQAEESEGIIGSQSVSQTKQRDAFTSPTVPRTAKEGGVDRDGGIAASWGTGMGSGAPLRRRVPVKDYFQPPQAPPLLHASRDEGEPSRRGHDANGFLLQQRPQLQWQLARQSGSSRRREESGDEVKKRHWEQKSSPAVNSYGYVTHIRVGYPIDASFTSSSSSSSSSTVPPAPPHPPPATTLLRTAGLTNARLAPSTQGKQIHRTETCRDSTAHRHPMSTSGSHQSASDSLHAAPPPHLSNGGIPGHGPSTPKYSAVKDDNQRVQQQLAIEAMRVAESFSRLRGLRTPLGNHLFKSREGEAASCATEENRPYTRRIRPSMLQSNAADYAPCFETTRL